MCVVLNYLIVHILYDLLIKRATFSQDFTMSYIIITMSITTMRHANPVIMSMDLIWSPVSGPSWLIAHPELLSQLRFVLCT
jgi:hypothetical protein